MSDKLNAIEAIGFRMMKEAARDAFRICSDTCENIAKEMEDGKLPKVDGVSALRLAASMFAASANKS